MLSAARPATAAAAMASGAASVAATSSTDAAATKIAAIATETDGPTSCGSPRTPVSASSSASPTVLAKCAATPQQAPAATRLACGNGAPGSAVATTTGTRPNDSAKGTALARVSLSRTSYIQADP